MSHYPSQDGADALVGTEQLDLVFTAGTAGAVPSALTYSTGITSVTLSTNDYLVVFDRGYVGFLNGFGNVIQASPSTSTANSVKVTAVDAGAGTATITPQKPDGTPLHLATGDKLSFTFRFTALNQPNAS